MFAEKPAYCISPYVSTLYDKNIHQKRNRAKINSYRDNKTGQCSKINHRKQISSAICKGTDGSISDALPQKNRKNA